MTKGDIVALFWFGIVMTGLSMLVLGGDGLPAGAVALGMIGGAAIGMAFAAKIGGDNG